MLIQYPAVVYDACSIETNPLDTYDDDISSQEYFLWGYYDAQSITALDEDNPMVDNPWYCMGFEDRKYEISVGIPYSLEFLPSFGVEEF